MAEILPSLKNFENKKVDKFFSELVNFSLSKNPRGFGGRSPRRL